MSKMELLGALEATKLTEQKWEQYCGTPFTLEVLVTNSAAYLSDISFRFIDSLLAVPSSLLKTSTNGSN